MKVTLNKRTIGDAAYQRPGGCYLWDKELVGYGLRIYPSGRKAFVVTDRACGRQRFYTLARYGELTPQQARTEALETLARARKGEDPAGERQASRNAPTGADLADQHIRDHVQVRSKPRAVKRTRQLWDGSVLPRLGKRRVADIRRPDVARLMTDMAETPTMANKVLEDGLGCRNRPAGEPQTSAQPARSRHPDEGGAHAAGRHPVKRGAPLRNLAFRRDLAPGSGCVARCRGGPRRLDARGVTERPGPRAMTKS